MHCSWAGLTLRDSRVHKQTYGSACKGSYKGQVSMAMQQHAWQGTPRGMVTAEGAQVAAQVKRSHHHLTFPSRSMRGTLVASFTVTSSSPSGFSKAGAELSGSRL